MKGWGTGRIITLVLDMLREGRRYGREGTNEPGTDIAGKGGE